MTWYAFILFNVQFRIFAVALLLCNSQALDRTSIG